MIVAAIITAVAGLALAGLALLWFGFRGRTIDDHPWCRKCRYDLSGLDAAAKCPECGLDLTRAGNRRLGQRLRRPVVITIGLLLLFVSLTFTAFLANPGDWTRYKPAWLLWADLHQGGAHGDAALGEFVRRARAGRLAERRANRIADLALLAQADTSARWEPLWGDFMEAAWLTRRITEDRYDSFIHNGFQSSITIDVRPKVREGQPIPIRLTIAPDRFGSGGRWPLLPEVSIQSGDSGAIELGDVTWRHATITGGRPVWWADGVLSLNLEPGRHTLSVEFNFHERFPLNAVVQSFQFKVVDHDAQVIGRVSDPDRVDEVRRSIDVEVVHGRHRGHEVRGGGLIYFTQPFAHLSFDVYARHDSKEHKVGSVAAPANQNTLQYLETHPREVFPGATHVDLILRASPTAAEKTTSIDEVWDGEVVITNVPITFDLDLPNGP